MSDTKSVNPANSVELPKGYRPMSDGQLKLEVPERPGYHRHWFRGDAGRIARARQAGYTHVQIGDVQVNNFDLGGDATKDGNSDLGSLVSITSGGTTEDGQPERMYLMECPDEIFEHAQSILAARVDSVAEALRGGMVGADRDTAGDKDSRYLKGKVPDLFIPKRRT